MVWGYTAREKVMNQISVWDSHCMFAESLMHSGLWNRDDRLQICSAFSCLKALTDGAATSWLRYASYLCLSHSSLLAITAWSPISNKRTLLKWVPVRRRYNLIISIIRSICAVSLRCSGVDITSCLVMMYVLVWRTYVDISWRRMPHRCTWPWGCAPTGRT